MRPLLFTLIAALALAAPESRLPDKEMRTVESAVNDRFRAPGADPYDLLGTARGSYLPGYGALFTLELELVYVNPPMPMRIARSPAEIAATHERKLKKLPILKQQMRELMAEACSQLDALPLNEHVSIEAFLWNYNWEDSHGLPRSVFMTAEKRRLLNAQAAHSDLAGVIGEQER